MPDTQSHPESLPVPHPHLDPEDSLSARSSSDVEDSETELEPTFSITLQLHNKPTTLPIYDSDATIQQLSEIVSEELHIPASNQKFLITPKIGLLKPPFKDPSLSLHTLQDKKIVLLGATSAEVDDLTSELASRRARAGRRRAALQAGRKVKAEQRRDWKKVQDEARYTFHSIRPLAGLSNPDKSLRFLERLRDDAGIKATMRKHGFSVGLLTEMDPASHTTHDSRTLGLNRNRGEMIELRLRTDAYDGYRDYKVIRKTLCHELTHNVWSEHDQHFWKLCREIEAEVDRNDWRRGGHSVGREEFYNPNDDGIDTDDEEADGGGWVGGEYVLGGSITNTSASGTTTTAATGRSLPAEPLTRREILARAAEERMKKQTETKAPDATPKDPTTGQD